MVWWKKGENNRPFLVPLLSLFAFSNPPSPPFPKGDNEDVKCSPPRGYHTKRHRAVVLAQREHHFFGDDQAGRLGNGSFSNCPSRYLVSGIEPSIMKGNVQTGGRPPPWKEIQMQNRSYLPRK